MKLVHAADLHLGVRPTLLSGLDLPQLQLRALDEVLDIAGTIDAVLVFSGDLFDSNRVPSELSRAVAARLRAATARIVLLPGGGAAGADGASGHDAYTRDSVYRRAELQATFGDRVVLLTPEMPVCRFGSTAFYGGFFAMPDCRLESDADRHVAVVHAATGAWGGVADTSLANGGFDYVALGHFHRMTVRTLEAGGSRREDQSSSPGMSGSSSGVRGGSGRGVTEDAPVRRGLPAVAAYTGALVQFEFLKGDDASSGYLLVDLDETVRVTPSILEWAPRFRKVELTDDAAVDQLRAEMGPHDYVSISGYVEELQAELDRACRETGRIGYDGATVYRPADAVVQGAVAAIRRELLADCDGELVDGARDLVLEALRTGGGKQIGDRIVDDLRRASRDDDAAGLSRRAD